VQTAPRGQGGLPWRLRLTDMLGSALRHWQGGPEVEESEPAAQQGGRPDGCTAELEGGPRGTDSRQLARRLSVAIARDGLARVPSCRGARKQRDS
jgi:hypothetical protein